ncbi:MULTISPECIES: RNA 2'-phosphotransferase [unclassified Mycobacterium]|uniref:RNA 2'-phosphotransferase n=1 Tax=unclassified Mycobacterium TaxID=2642494 RepID=UPI000B018337|nr:MULTISPECIES: RNA 2'-phosphotransferase [unclassified Mycobacterium]
MTDGFKVDPAALHVGSNDMFNAIGQAAVEFLRHEEGLAGAAPGWVGSSQLALAELAARWEIRHDQHRLRVDGLGSHVAEAMFSYATNEDDSARAFGSLRDEG